MADVTAVVTPSIATGVTGYVRSVGATRPTVIAVTAVDGPAVTVTAVRAV
jgi:hypothetical protein